MSNTPDLKPTSRLVVAHSVNPYCPASWLYHQIIFLKRFQAVVLTKRKEKAESFPFAPLFAQYDLPWYRRAYEKLYQKWTGTYFPQHERALRDHHVCLLHSHFCQWGMENVPLAQALGIPHLTTFYGADIWANWQDQAWRQRFVRFAAATDQLLVEGNAMRQKVIELGAPPDKVKIFHLGLDLSKIEFIPRHVGPDGQIRILMAGRAYEKKGHIYGLRAFARLAQQYPQLRLDLIIGGTSAKARRCLAEMREFIRQSGVDDRITWSALLPYDEYLRRIQRAHIFLQPSVMAADGDAEGGFPVTIIEMSAAGVPIVASRHCDIPEAVLDGKTGVLADERDVDGLAQRLEFLIQQPERWLTYGQAGRAHVEQEYNIRVQIELLENCYAALLGRGYPA